MPSPVPVREVPVSVAAPTFLSVIAIICIGLTVFHADLHLLMLIGLGIVTVSVMVFAKATPLAVIVTVARGIWRARVALVIFALIGIIISTFIHAGTVPTLVDWGIHFISPRWFLPAALLVCSLMSIATGTAWGTAGTLGVILVGLGTTLGIPPALVAGVVVSGACFGDKMSPVSDTTNLAAMASEVDLYRHIRSMVYTTAPAYLIVLVAYTVVGFFLGGSVVDEGALLDISSEIRSHYHLGWVTLIPIAILLIAAWWKVPSPIAMSLAILAATAIAWWWQAEPLTAVLGAWWSGSGPTTSVTALNDLLGRGGLVSMWFTMLLSVEALALGALLSEFGYMRTIIRAVLRRVRRIGTMVSTSILAGIVGNLGMGEAYLSIVLGGQLFRSEYDARGVDRAVLSRSLEEGATLSTPLVPWTTAGVFFAGTLGVSTLAYLPYAWLNLVNPLIGIIVAYLGWAGVKPSLARPDRSLQVG